MDAKQYMTELAQKAGLDSSTTDALLKAADKPEFAKELSAGVMRQSDYSRNLDTLKTQEQALLDNQAKWTKFHQDNVDYVKDLEAKAAGRGGDGGTGVTSADLDKRLKEATDKAVAINVNITKQALRVADDYRSRFGKPLDIEALEKLALEKNLPISAAYDDMIRPEMEAKSKADQEKLIADARAEGAREALSKHNLPVDNAAAEQAPFFQSKPADAQPLTEGARARGFAETWNQSAGS